MTDIERIIDLITNKDYYWEKTDDFYNLHHKMFENNDVIYLVTTSQFGALSFDDWEVSKYIRLAMIYLDINKPFNVLHPRTELVSVYEINAPIVKFNKTEYSCDTSDELTDTQYNVYFKQMNCSESLAMLLYEVIHHWSFDKIGLFVKILDKYRDYINFKRLVNDKYIEFEFKVVLIRFMNDNGILMEGDVLL